MNSEVSKEIKQVFDLASLRHEAKNLRTPSDWDQAKSIMEKHKNDMDEEKTRYYSQYDARVQKATKILIDKAGQKNKDYKRRWFGLDNFDKNAITRDAHRLVQRDHQNRLNKIGENEKQALDKLMNGVQERDKHKGQSQYDFNEAVDRRVETDRRNPQQPPRSR